MSTASIYDMNATELRAYVRQACENARGPEDLTAESIFGLSSEEVQRLRRAANSPSDNGLDFSRFRSRQIETAGSVFVIADSGVRADVVRRMAQGISDAVPSTPMVVICSGSLSPIIPSFPGHLTVKLPGVQDTTQTMRIGRRLVAVGGSVPSEDYAATLGFHDGSLVAGDGRLALWLDHERLYLRANPWNSNGSLTTAANDSRSATFARLLQQAQAVAPAAPADYAPAAPISAALADIVAALDMLGSFRRLHETAPGDRRERLVAARQRAINEVAQARQALIEAVRRQTDAERELEDFDNGAGRLDTHATLQALREVHRIRSLPGVRSVEVAPDEGSNPAITVTLHPVVIGNGRTRRLIKHLRFTFILNTSTDVPQVQWDMDYSSDGGDQSPHPHVSTGGTTCWGQADAPLRQALARNEFATAVTLICGWARIYNGHSPYVRIDNFPRTNLPAGWQQSLPVT